jgi:HSP20 family protein
MALTRIQRRGGAPVAFRPAFTSTLPELDEFEQGVRRAVGDVFGTDLFTHPVGWMPYVDIAETNDALILTAELPGMTEKNVFVEFEDGVLTLRGEKEEEKKQANGDRKFHLYERSYGAFRRSFTFPRIVDAEKITAAFKDGLLTITLPKTAQAKAKGRQIPIAAK